MKKPRKARKKSRQTILLDKMLETETRLLCLQNTTTELENQLRNLKATREAIFGDVTWAVNARLDGIYAAVIKWIKYEKNQLPSQRELRKERDETRKAAEKFLGLDK